MLYLRFREGCDSSAQGDLKGLWDSEFSSFNGLIG